MLRWGYQVVIHHEAVVVTACVEDAFRQAWVFDVDIAIESKRRLMMC